MGEWDRHNAAHRVEFARYLQPLVIASRCKTFTAAEASVYMLTMKDVPREVLGQSVLRLIDQGVTWMPKPGDIKRVCCDMVDERRQAAVAQSEALMRDCQDCFGSGWANAEGPNAVERCRCHARAVELVAAAGQALARPQLPAASDPEVTL